MLETPMQRPAVTRAFDDMNLGGIDFVHCLNTYMRHWAKALEDECIIRKQLYFN
jgi:hypothetical protein